MHFQTLALALSLGLQALASPLEVNIFEKRRDPTCTSYGRANGLLTACPSNTAFCSSVLGRGPSTTTITKTSRVASPPPYTLITRHTTSTTVLTVVQTSTTTVNPPAINVVVGSSSTYPYPSCQLGNQPASAVTGACSCLLDQTATVMTVITKGYSPIPTTTKNVVFTTRTTVTEVVTTTR